MATTELIDDLAPGLDGDMEAERRIAHEGVPRGLSVDGIGKKYDKRVVLRDVSLSVRRGEVVGLLGPNGAGKTTCFYSIMGLAHARFGPHPARRRTTSPRCRCTGARRWALAICRRKPRSSAA